MLRLLEKRQKAKGTNTKKKLVRTNTETKKAPRTLEETCSAKPDYEIILMDDGTKSCRKKCRDPKPVRSSSQSRKCIRGQTINEPPRVPSSHHSAKGGPRTLEQTCAAKPDYELIDMDDGTKSCRKKCRDPKPVRSSSQSRKCIMGIIRPHGKTKRTRAKKVEEEEEEAEYDEDEDEEDEDDEDSGSDDEYYDADFVDNDEDFDERTEQELDNILQNKFKKPKISSQADCLQAVSVKQMKDEIKKRETDEFEKGYEAVEEEEFAKKRKKSQKSPSQRKSQKSPSQRKSQKSPSQRMTPPRPPPQPVAPELTLAERNRLRQEKYKNKAKVAPMMVAADDIARPNIM